MQSGKRFFRKLQTKSLFAVLILPNLKLLSKNDSNIFRLTLQDIFADNNRLQAIYNGEYDRMENLLTEMRKQMGEKAYKYELVLCFWVSVHLKKLDFTKFIHGLDPALYRTISKLRTEGKEKLIEYKEAQAYEKYMKKKGKEPGKKPNEPLKRSDSQSSQTSSTSSKRKKKAKYAAKKESGDIENQEQLEDIDYLLR